MNQLQDTALQLLAHGFSVVPTRTDGTKAPAGAWAQYQQQPPTLEAVTAWFDGDTHDGLGIITGAVSGNCEMFELEGRAVAAGVFNRMTELAANSDLGELWDRVTSGYLEFTPTAGMHTYYRITDGPARGNTKLARDEAGNVLVETRGEGGFSVIAPSGGRTHPNGSGWVLVKGGIDMIADITSAERDALHTLARAMTSDPTPPPPSPAPIPSQRTTEATGERPGDLYNANTTWDELLTPRDWTRVYTDAGGVTYWRRPGKRIGLSATTGRATHDRADADNLYVFSTSTDFESEIPYSKFGAYTLLEHAGDFAGATKALVASGFGRPLESVPTISTQVYNPPPVIDITDGSLATVHQLQTAATETLAESDDGNAIALLAAHGHEIRFCYERQRWLWWDGCRWQWQTRGGGYVRELMKDVARDLETEGKTRHKQRALSAVGTSAALQQAETDPRITVSIDDLDNEPWELNTPGGIVNLKTGELSPNDPAKLHTRVTAVTPDFDTDVTAWLRFLAATFDSAAELIDYLQRLVGYSAVGTVGPHVLPFCHGSGGNGKGVLLETCAGVLGDYATTAPVGFLMGRMTGHETEIARLAGARMVICSEVNEDDVFDEAKVKQLTGGDTLTARFMRQDHFSFTPSHQLWLMGNTQPTVRTGGRAFWRRLRMIPFEHEVSESDIVDDLQGQLIAEHGPAILAWVIAGAVSYATSGLLDPPSVKAATADYAVSQDTVARFVDDRLALGGGEGVKVKMSIVREAYEQWCRSEGVSPITATAFGRAIKRFGIETFRTHGVRFYTNATLLSTDQEFDESGTPERVF